LTTLLLADEGTATAGFDVVKEYSRYVMLWVICRKIFLYQDLTVEENLKFCTILALRLIEENYDIIKDIYIQIAPFKIDVLENFQAE
jgi:ABC-type Na+ transport system ATPase subunit NatA